MRYEERVLAFIDILGFKNAVENTIQYICRKNNEKCTHCKKDECSERKDVEIIMEIDKIDHLFNEKNYQLLIGQFISRELKIKDRVVSQFSDSVVISYSKDDFFHHILFDIYFLCVMALENNFLFRGAVVYGKVNHTKTTLFGPAFLKAYDMEQKKAIFPRIIIDNSFLDIAKDNYSKCANPDAEYNGLLELISCDFDGLKYLNYIDPQYTGVGIKEEEEQKHRKLISENIKEMEKKINTDDSIKCKYLWLKEKFAKSRKT
jgi:hypothetical protein